MAVADSTNRSSERRLMRDYVLGVSRRLIRPLTIAVFVAVTACPVLGQVSGSEVLLLYCNETAPRGDALVNYNVILSWLDSAPVASCSARAEALRRDLNYYPGSVDRQIAAIGSAYPAGTLGHARNVMVFTNRLAQMHICLVGKGGGPLGSMPFELTSPVPDDYILDSSPLSALSALDDALELAAKTFDPSRHTFDLVVDSHGNSRLVAAPMLTVRHEELHRETLVANTLGLFSLLPEQYNRYGIAAKYFQWILCWDHTDFMKFGLVFVYSCDSARALEGRYVPKNVRRLRGCPDRVQAGLLDYGEILSMPDRSTTLADAIDQAFDRALNPPVDAPVSAVRDPHRTAWIVCAVFVYGATIVYMAWWCHGAVVHRRALRGLEN